jgi:hypothetical protein
MHLSFFEWMLWLAVAVAQFGVAFRMLISGAWRRWPSLFLFVLVLAIKDIARIANAITLQNSWVDFSVYWSASLIAELLEVWIIVQIAQWMFGISVWAIRLISRAVIGIAAISVATSIILNMKGVLFSWQTLCTTADRLSNAVALAWVFVLFVVVVCSDRVSEWSAGVRGIAFGITLELTADCYLGWLRITNSQLAHLDVIKSALFLVSLFAWGVSTGPRKTDEQLPMTLASVLNGAQNLQKLLRSF